MSSSITASARSFAPTPGPGWPSSHTRIALGRVSAEALRGEHVLDLRRADAEGERAEGAVRGGVAVAADDGHARLGQPEFGPDDVDDALGRRVEIVQPDAVGVAVLAQRAHLRFGQLVGHRQMARPGRDVVIERGDGEVGTPHRAAGQPQAFEGLRRRHLVNQVQVDVDEVAAAVEGLDDVRVPQFVEQRARRGHGVRH